MVHSIASVSIDIHLQYYNKVMLLDFVFIAVIVVLLIAVYKIKFSKESIAKEIEEKIEEKQTNVQTDQRNPIHTNQIAQNNNTGVAWNQQDSQSQEEGEEGVVDQRKQMRKQAKKKQKQQMQQARKQFLQSQKQKREEYEKKEEEKQKIQEEKRRKEQQLIAQLREEERKRKEQEFLKWKDMFKVQSEGKQKLSAEQETRKIQQFNKNLLTTLKKNKLSLLQDLSHKFKLPTKDIVQKIKEFEEKGEIAGIFDERGKYLVIQQNQWAAIKNYITVKGRVKKTEIMIECARLIKIPEQTENQLLDLIEVDAQK